MKLIYPLKLKLEPSQKSLPGFTLVESLISMVLLSLLAVGFWASMLTVMAQRSLNHRQELLARLPVLVDSVKVNPVPEMEWKRGAVTLKVTTVFGDSLNTFNWTITEKLKNGKTIERMKLITQAYSDPKKKKAEEVFSEIR